MRDHDLPDLLKAASMQMTADAERVISVTSRTSGPAVFFFSFAIFSECALCSTTAGFSTVQCFYTDMFKYPILLSINYINTHIT